MLVAVVIVLVIIIPVGLDVFKPYLSSSVEDKIVYILGILVAVSAFFTRIMAIPQVNAFLTKLGLGATKS